MSNRGIRELKRKKRRQAKKRRKKFLLTSLAAIALVLGTKFLKNTEEEFIIQRPAEYRQAEASDDIEEEKEVKINGDKIHIATQAGFKDIAIDEDKKIADDKYEDNLVEYVRCAKTQYAYQYPNDYSKTEKFIKEGDYVAYYGTENGFSKIKMDDSFYYVNKFGLEKLDPEANIKVVNGISYVSEAYPLPSDFNPGLDKTAMRAFETMRQDMEREGLSIKIASDYRDYDLERKMKEAGEVDSENPGTSEHQLGQAFDFFTEGSKYSDKFATTKEYKWLCENAYKYGFIERYPEDKEDSTNHRPMPWHFRFLGVENAKEIYENDLSLEEYLKIN
ncbi:MAG: M15 family metallopeptidase [Anaerococcus sp.]|uniref:M15 family metallopeptidase n=1 Tax=Anaerococcus sp. TaxID=1872515 RepID=UPI002613A878|nr:M15 family metallopeptidase [Anaerococcus sp.]MCI5972025.1 M15 family metallopeptidase [Anaerococcus sp.]MDD6918366.1 M15 family metallopeptidase [Peptoniphilaceae bacterium]MDY2927249.1 M15 family metallopeptidase [Anaerococcus sp.]